MQIPKTLFLLLAILLFSLPNCHAVAEIPHVDSPERKLSHKMFRAIRSGDSVTVRKLLDRGANPNMREIRLTQPRLATNYKGGKEYLGRTAIAIASETNKLGAVIALVEHGADVNGLRQLKDPPLVCATSFFATVTGSDKLVSYLLTHGADANFASLDGHLAIEKAARTNSVKIVNTLLNHGSKIDGTESASPLLEAVMCNSVEVVNLLIEKKADLNKRYEGKTVLECAETESNDKISRILRAAGAGGRTKIQMEREADTKKRVEIAASFTSLQSQKVTNSVRKPISKPVIKQATPIVRPVTPQDMEVFEAIVNNMLAPTGQTGSPFMHPGTKVYLEDLTVDINLESIDSVGNFADDDQANDVTLSIRRSLIRHNVSEVRLKNSVKKNSNYQVTTSYKIDTMFYSNGAPPANFAGYARFSRPGYSTSRNEAFVHLIYGPTPHGSTADYFLIRKRGVWKVKWNAISWGL